MGLSNVVRRPTTPNENLPERKCGPVGPSLAAEKRNVDRFGYLTDFFAVVVFRTRRAARRRRWRPRDTNLAHGRAAMASISIRKPWCSSFVGTTARAGFHAPKNRAYTAFTAPHWPMSLM